MYLDFPSPIDNDSDLEFYENYLKQEFKTTQHSTFVEYLKRYIGFTLKIDCAIGNRIDTKIGKLTEVGEDFILLNIAPTNQKTMVRLGNVKFVTILKK
jgi:hypothetical protein